MRVIRVERPDGQGPYCTGLMRWPPPYDFNNQPPPHFDNGLKGVWDILLQNCEYHEWFFGFQDEVQAMEWFYRPEWWQAMDKAGCRLVYYDTDAMVIGEKQVIFRKDQATRVGEELLGRFYNAKCGCNSLQT